MPSETPLLNAIRKRASELGARLFRNNTGMIRDADGRTHRFGLTVGGSDLIGYVPVRVTASMVGLNVAVFVAIEVKAGKTATTPEQLAFIQAVWRAGGLAGVARNIEEAEAILCRK